MKKYIITAVALLFVAAPLSNAQLSKTIVVTGTEEATDCISLTGTRQDTDVIVKFRFDESKNSLIVSLVSYRALLVLNESMRFSKAFRFGKLKPANLNYIVKDSPKTSFTASGEFRKSLPKPVSSYLFRRWVEYEGLQPVPGEYSLVNDHVEQEFQVLDGRSVVSITLRDIMMVDPCKKEGRYNVVLDKDVRARYDIAVLRNPCFGKDEEVKAADDAYGAIKAAYDSLLVMYGNGTVSNKQDQTTFNKMKSVLVKQFPPRDADSDCDCIREDLEQYNELLGKISKLNVKVVSNAKPAQKGINANTMLSRARKIDQSVSRWLVSTDPNEKGDILKNCRKMISAANEEIRTQGVYTKAQMDAQKAFQAAEAYFNRTCR